VDIKTAKLITKSIQQLAQSEVMWFKLRLDAKQKKGDPEFDSIVEQANNTRAEAIDVLEKLLTSLGECS